MAQEKYTLVEGGIEIRTRLASDSKETYQLFLDATVVGRESDQFAREEKAARILELLDDSGIGRAGRDGIDNPDFLVQIGFSRAGYGVFGMNAELLWPSVSDKVASELATSAMRSMARDVGLCSEDQINRMVYASVSRAHGITLETNPIGSCSLDTDGSDYRSDQDRVSLYAHNLYTHEMQLVCLSGLIAIASLRE